MPNIKHRMSRLPDGQPSAEYQAWAQMKQRCYNRKLKSYRHYGGRGIFVCDRWLTSFEAFLSDMGVKPFPELSLDREDNDGPYSPENCRWADATTQIHNRRNLGERKSRVLTRVLVFRLYRLNSRGFSSRRVAKILGIGHSTVQRVLSGEITILRYGEDGYAVVGNGRNG